MSHPRLNNPRTYRVKLTEAARVRRVPRHGFRADRSVEALFCELSDGQTKPWYQAGSPDVAFVSTSSGLNVWCCDGKFIWSGPFGTTVTHPANDPSGAAALLNSMIAPHPRVSTAA
ncbi:hypothetical protein NI17_018385 [Thermobifida halotolerans]|uniref:Uncharacterized protein n=1 Tax=Thermobifida halotolerans TaxID=483545 RepID=A0A399FW04_9ACTN|nr:hypothetical protein NI17_018385 [Thermobifida halotolerans]